MAATCKLTPARSYTASPFAPVLPGVLAVLRMALRALKNRREARLLTAMDDRMLADIGLTRSDLRDAYSEPIWRDPTNLLACRALEKRRNRQPGLSPPMS